MSRRTQKNVGVIGLGIIGRRVADSLRRRGFHVFVWNRTPRPFPNFVGAPEEIAQLCDFVQLFVSDDDALLEMIERMKRTLSPHHVVMAHSTVAPSTMRAAAELVHRRGGQLLDAPFTGSKMAAEKGELVYYVAGDDAAFRRARPVLEASSKEIIEIGEIGQATTIKLATNIITAATVQVTAEALALVQSSGVGLEKFAEAMRGNASNSATLAMKLPKMLEGDFEPHFSVKHMLKDVNIATRLARSYGLSLAATEAARDSLAEETRRGRGDDDYSGMVRAFFPDGGLTKEEKEPEAEQPPLAGLEEVAAPEAVPVEPELAGSEAVAAAEIEEPVAEKAADAEAKADESAASGDAIGNQGPLEVEKPAEADTTVEVEKSAEVEKAGEISEVQKSAELERSAEVQKPAEVEKSAEVEAPADEVKRGEATEDSKSEAPDDSEPAAEDARVLVVDNKGEGAAAESTLEDTSRDDERVEEKRESQVAAGGDQPRNETAADLPPKNGEAVVAGAANGGDAPKESKPEEPRRGFFSRMFGKAGDP